MSVRELVVLGTASQVPTRHRNHNGYLLRWDGDGLLFDPGEGTQRRMTLAGVSAHDVTHICLTHFHGDHCLGLPGVLQRMSLDGVPYPVRVHYPRDGQPYLDRLRPASVYHDTVDVRERPVDGAGVHRDDTVRLETRPLSHPVTSAGYRIVAPDRRKMIPRRLVLSHLSGRYGADEEHRFRDEAREVFAAAGHPGAVHLASDLERISVRGRLPGPGSDNAEGEGERSGHADGEQERSRS